MSLFLSWATSIVGIDFFQPQDSQDWHFQPRIAGFLPGLIVGHSQSERLHTSGIEIVNSFIS